MRSKEEQVSIPVEPQLGSLRRLARAVGNDEEKARTLRSKVGRIIMSLLMHNDDMMN